MKKIKLIVCVSAISLIFVKLSFAPPAQPAPMPQTPTANTGEMVSVPAGEFMMGCNEAVDNQCEVDEKPYHKVYLNAFHIDKFEVTLAQYQACIKAGKCSMPNAGQSCNWGVSGRDNHPINCVDWNQAKAYCEYVGKRLPTEAQWEKAARGTDGRKYPWGNQNANCNFAVMNDNGIGCGKDSTWPVGSKPAGASPYGAMDMAGNVSEWTADWDGENYYSSSPKKNPAGPGSGRYRVFRGGGWSFDASGVRSSLRGGGDPARKYFNGGFRCVK